MWVKKSSSVSETADTTQKDGCRIVGQDEVDAEIKKFYEWWQKEIPEREVEKFAHVPVTPYALSLLKWDAVIGEKLTRGILTFDAMTGCLNDLKKEVLSIRDTKPNGDSRNEIIGRFKDA